MSQERRGRRTLRRGRARPKQRVLVLDVRQVSHAARSNWFEFRADEPPPFLHRDVTLRSDPANGDHHFAGIRPQSDRAPNHLQLQRADAARRRSRVRTETGIR